MRNYYQEIKECVGRQNPIVIDIGERADGSGSGTTVLESMTGTDCTIGHHYNYEREIETRYVKIRFLYGSMVETEVVFWEPSEQYYIVSDIYNNHKAGSGNVLDTLDKLKEYAIQFVYRDASTMQKILEGIFELGHKTGVAHQQQKIRDVLGIV